jgi:type 1 glutamine amidotransferase
MYCSSEAPFVLPNLWLTKAGRGQQLYAQLGLVPRFGQ